jgi:hypothetical protein
MKEFKFAKYEEDQDEAKDPGMLELGQMLWHSTPNRWLVWNIQMSRQRLTPHIC